MEEQTRSKLNLGCGPVQPRGWTNIDGSRRAWLASQVPALDNLLVRWRILPPTEFDSQTKFVNLLKGLPFGDASVQFIYAGELWEHLESEEALNLTKECYRVLIGGGILRVCVPDGPAFWAKYLKLYDQEMAKPPENRDSMPLEAHTKMFFNDIATRPRLLRSLGHYHKWQYDEIQLVSLFKKGGFSEVERKRFRESRIPDIAAVERSDFLIVEAVK